MKFYDEFLDYLRYERNYSNHTLLAYSRDLSQFEDFLKIFCEEDIDSSCVDADRVRSWIVYLLEQGLSPTSVNRKLSSLKSFFKYLVKQKVIVTSPVRYLKGPKCGKKLPTFVKEGDMQSLLESDGFGEDFEGVRDRLILEMLYVTGMRRAELCGLKDVDVDNEAMLIKVTGKRNKQRLIPFSESLKSLLVIYIYVRTDEVESGLGQGYFFLRKNGKPLDVASVYKIVKKNLESIPMLQKRSPHVLRHSFATSMLNNGAELNAVKEILGHGSLASTSVYTHTTFEELKKMYHAHPRAKKEGGNYGS